MCDHSPTPAPQPTRTADDLAKQYEEKGVIFATVRGQPVNIMHDEEGNGIYAWREGVDGAIASFGEDWTPANGKHAPDEGWSLVARWLNSDGAEGSL